MQSSTVQVNRDQDALASADEARSQHLVDMIRKALGFGSPEVKRGPGPAVQAESAVTKGRELPDAGLGNGPVWSLKDACARSAASRAAKGALMQGHLFRMAKGQLDQALSCDRHTDMRFELDDGTTVGGHRSVLSLASEDFGAMFNIGMVEESVVLMPGAKASDVKALFEWMYLGHAGENCEKADGRVLWVLAEMYNIAGVREWLQGEALDVGNFCAACEFGLLPKGDRRELVVACRSIARGLEWDDLDIRNAVEDLKCVIGDDGEYKEVKVEVDGKAKGQGLFTTRCVERGLVGVGSGAMHVLLRAFVKGIESENESESEEEDEEDEGGGAGGEGLEADVEMEEGETEDMADDDDQVDGDEEVYEGQVVTWGSWINGPLEPAESAEDDADYESDDMPLSDDSEDEEDMSDRVELGFRFLNKWWMANGGEHGEERVEDVERLVDLLDLRKLSMFALAENVRMSGLVSADQMSDIYEQKILYQMRRIVVD